MRWLGILLLLVGLAACENDATGSGGDFVRWSEVRLPSEPSDGGILSLASGGGRTFALAISSSGAWVLEESGPGFEVLGGDPLPETVGGYESARFATSLVVDAQDRMYVVGTDAMAVHPVVWWEDGDTWSSVVGSSFGALQAVVGFGASGVVATGTGPVSVPVVIGSAEGGFEFGDFTAGTSAGEKGLVDLAFEDGQVYGVGFDDRGEGTPEQPWRIVSRFDGEEWGAIESPCGSCAGIGFRAVAASAAELLVGGSIVVDSSAPVTEHAWLASWSEGEWTTIEVPDADLVQQINDILVASDGTVYFAAGGYESPAYLLSADPGQAPVIEWTRPGIRLWALTETADGRILAAGLQPGPQQGVPIVVERDH